MLHLLVSGMQQRALGGWVNTGQKQVAKWHTCYLK